MVIFLTAFGGLQFCWLLESYQTLRLRIINTIFVFSFQLSLLNCLGFSQRSTTKLAFSLILVLFSSNNDDYQDVNCIIYFVHRVSFNQSVKGQP